MLTGLYTHQTGCMITGGSTLDPGFPTWGTMLREHGYHTRWLRQVASHPPRQPLERVAAANAALERYGFAGGMFPSPDGGPGQGWHCDPHIARAVRRLVPRTRAAPGRGARPCRSSTRTTSPGGTCGATASPAEASARRDRRAPAAQLRDARAARRARQAAPAALAAGNRRRVLRRRCRSTAPNARAKWLAVPRPLHEAPARGRPPRRPRAAHAREPARTWPPTPSSCSPPTTASTAPRTGCAARARAPTRRRSACR